MLNAPIPTTSVTDEVLAQVFVDGGVTPRLVMEGTVFLPGPGVLALQRNADTNRLAFECGLTFGFRTDLVTKKRFLNHLVTKESGFRAHVNDDGRLICSHDLVLARHLLPTRVLHSYRYFRAAMERVLAAGEGILS